MTLRTIGFVGLVALLGMAPVATVRADCESDMDTLDQAMKTPSLTPAARTILQDAKKKAVEAVKKDDDATCNKVITEAMSRAGVRR